MSSRHPALSAARWIALGVAFLIVLQSTFHLNPPDFVNGISLGALYGIIAVGIILLYRALRILNFATAAIGAVPAIYALMLDVQGHLNYWQALPIAVLGGALIAVAVDIIVMRRFQGASRLIATVVTIGLAQTSAIFAFFIPIWMGSNAGTIQYVPTTWAYVRILNSRGEPIVNGNQVFALVSVLLVSTAIWAFLRYTKIGIALRASSENADRAGLLGIPVKTVQTVAWALAGALSGLAIYGQAPLIGIPRDATLGFDPLLYGLAAAVIAAMDGIFIALAAGMAIGLIIFGSVSHFGDDSVASALMLVIILVSLAARRRSLARAFSSGVATWREVKQFKKVPSQLARIPEVRVAGWTLTAIFVGVLVGLPLFLKDPDIPLLTLVPLYGIVAVSLVVLTGWAGQISLGQFGIVGVAAGVAGGLVANHGIDFFAAIGIAILTGAGAAIVIGIPALRVQGLYLAVTTLAFGYVTQYYILNDHYFIGQHIMPQGYAAHVERPLLYGLIDLTDARNFYWVCVAFLFLTMGAAGAFRRFRSGRVLMAARDNQRAAVAYGINITGARLAAFAISGGIAGIAGILFAYQQHNVVYNAYSVQSSITIFLAVSIGGLGSLPSAVLSAMSLEAFVAFAPRLYHYFGENAVAVIPLLVTGPLLIIQMSTAPGGLAEGLYKVRDDFLRAVAAQYKLVVPSLVADREASDAELGFKRTLTTAVHELEEGAKAKDITCPVCSAKLTLKEAAEHEHLNPKIAAGAGVEK